jgi:predicted nucleotidyltransferase
MDSSGERCEWGNRAKEQGFGRRQHEPRQPCGIMARVSARCGPRRGTQAGSGRRRRLSRAVGATRPTLRRHAAVVMAVSASVYSMDRGYARYVVHTSPVDLSHPSAAFGPASDLRVLRELAADATPRSGRRIAHQAGVAHSTALRVLDRLVAEGVVVELDAGRARLFSLNEDHVLAPAIRGIAGARELLLDRMRDEIGRWSVSPRAALVFGSAARGDGGPASDIDLLLVRDGNGTDAVWREQLDGLAERVRAWSGNHLGVVEMAPGELMEAVALVDEVRRDGIELTDGALRVFGAASP